MELLYIIILFAWIATAALAAHTAQLRGQSPGAALLIAVLFSPLIGFLWVIALPNKHDELRHQQLLHALGARSIDARNPEQLPHTATEPVTSHREPAIPLTLPLPKQGPGPFAFVLIILLILIAIIGGIAQLGSSANATFTTISGSM